MKERRERSVLQNPWTLHVNIGIENLASPTIHPPIVKVGVGKVLCRCQITLVGPKVPTKAAQRERSKKSTTEGTGGVEDASQKSSEGTGQSKGSPGGPPWLEGRRYETPWNLFGSPGGDPREGVKGENFFLKFR